MKNIICITDILATDILYFYYVKGQRGYSTNRASMLE